MKKMMIRIVIPVFAVAALLLYPQACNREVPAGESALFDAAFSAMQTKANELGIKGVAMAAFLEDTTTLDWKMSTKVMGNIVFPHGENPGWNIIAMVGSKIGESMLTHAPSGHCPRPLMHGEVGFANAEDPLNGEGAEFIDLDGAWCVCAFGGGPHEKDYMVGQAGAQAIKKVYESQKN